MEVINFITIFLYIKILKFLLKYYFFKLSFVFLNDNFV